MTKNEIRQARKLLRDFSTLSRILDNKVGFYYYYNWQARQTNKLHYCECGHCAFGSGKHEEVDLGDNGVWIGPFISRDTARNTLLNVFEIQEIIDCVHCINL